jgi:hypothetical protein
MNSPSENRPLARRLVEKLDDAIMEFKARRGLRRARRTEEGQRRQHGLSAQELMCCFESLGDNCEFGLVQRRCGAEPLGLFRFASIRVGDLAAALEAGLADVVDPAAIEIIWVGDTMGAHHHGYDIKYGHTPYDKRALPPEKIRALMLQRLNFLARKLREILREGEKILVCRTRSNDDADDVLRVGKALRHLGPNTLLWVAPADTPEAVGSVKCISESVLKGAIEADSDWDNIRFDTWMAVCERAYALWPARNAMSQNRLGSGTNP